MDDPVAIALILSGSSAALALILVGRRILNERAESASRTAESAVGRPAADLAASPEASESGPDPADAAVEPTAPAGDDVFTAHIRSGGGSGTGDATHPRGDVFAAHISPDAAAPPASPRVATPADADVFDARIGEQGAGGSPSDIDLAAARANAAPGEDVFAGRIDPAAQVEESPVVEPEPDAPEVPSEPVSGADVFDSRIASPTPAAETTPAPAGDDPFASRIRALDGPDSDESADSIYPEDTCRAFAQGLRDDVLDRALTLFWALAREGSIDSNDLGALLGARSRQAGALISTPMKRRAEEMDLPLPYVIGRSSPSRLRTWSDQFGIADRMAAALLDEQQARDTMSDDDPEALLGLTEWLNAQPEAEVTMRLSEIDALVPGGLPEHAVSERNWWANRSGGPGHAHAEAWLTAGRLAYPDLRSGEVTFEVLPGLREAESSDAAASSDEAELKK